MRGCRGGEVARTAVRVLLWLCYLASRPGRQAWLEAWAGSLPARTSGPTAARRPLAGVFANNDASELLRGGLAHSMRDMVRGEGVWVLPHNGCSSGGCAILAFPGTLDEEHIPACAKQVLHLGFESYGGWSKVGRTAGSIIAVPQMFGARGTSMHYVGSPRANRASTDDTLCMPSHAQLADAVTASHPSDSFAFKSWTGGLDYWAWCASRAGAPCAPAPISRPWACSQPWSAAALGTELSCLVALLKRLQARHRVPPASASIVAPSSGAALPCLQSKALAVAAAG